MKTSISRHIITVSLWVLHILICVDLFSWLDDDDDDDMRKRTCPGSQTSRAATSQGQRNESNENTFLKTYNISRTLVDNKIVDHADVVGASPVGAASTTSLFLT